MNKRDIWPKKWNYTFEEQEELRTGFKFDLYTDDEDDKDKIIKNQKKTISKLHKVIEKQKEMLERR